MQFGENKCYTRNAIVTSIQSRDKLEDRRSKNDKVPTIV